MKYLFKILLVCFSLAFVACDSDNDHNYTIHAKWKVIDRVFVCEGDKELEKRVRYFLDNTYLRDAEYEYIEFKESLVYEEGYSKKEDLGGGSIIMTDWSRMTGRYEYNEELGLANVVIQNLSKSWPFVLKVEDANQEFIFLEQEMDKADIEFFLLNYFEDPSIVAEGLTATFKTKAVRMFKD